MVTSNSEFWIDHRTKGEGFTPPSFIHIMTTNICKHVFVSFFFFSIEYYIIQVLLVVQLKHLRYNVTYSLINLFV